jgi:hypothetical protein
MEPTFAARQPDNRMYGIVPIHTLTTYTHLQTYMSTEHFQKSEERTSVQSLIERASFVKRSVPDGDLQVANQQGMVEGRNAA